VTEVPQAIPCDAEPVLSVFGRTDIIWEAGLVDLALRLMPEWNVPDDRNDNHRNDYRT